MYTAASASNSQIEACDSAALDFSSVRPFVFVCNQQADRAWTPTALFEEYGITDFGKMTGVAIHVSTENFEQVLGLIEEWHECDMQVILRFVAASRRPAVGDLEDHTFMGLDVEECYEYGGRLWHASRALKMVVRDVFATDQRVEVETH